MQEHADRSRVLTLVFADLADSTALKTRYGDTAVGELIGRHRAHVERLCEECAGRIIDWAGDGCFLTFETSSAGVLFALQLQKAHADESDLPSVRVGIHMGEVTEKPGANGTLRIEGLAVDLAARICGLANPGQVLMSSAVYASARARLGVEAFGQPVIWQTHGTYELKGFDEPVDIGEAGFEGTPTEAPKAGEKAQLMRRGRRRSHVATPQSSRTKTPFTSRWAAAAILLAVLAGAAAVGINRAVRSPVTDEGDSAPAEASVGPIRSIAVLPFDNLSENAEHDYLASGLTESLTTELAKIGSIKVIFSTSAVRYRNIDLPDHEIAEQLGVEGLIRGSVIREGDEVRLTVRLIHAPSNTHVWADSYTNTVKSVVTLLSEAALAVADAISAELTGEERRRIAHTHEVHPEAYDAYVVGQYYSNNHITKDGLHTAIQQFEKAIGIDPEFGHAYGGLICAYWETVAQGFARPRDVFPKARAAGLRALALVDDLSTDHSHLGTILMGYDLEWEQAEERFLHALELSPNNAIAHLDYASYLSYVGRTKEALEHVVTAIDLDPTPVIFTLYTAQQRILLATNPVRVRDNLEAFVKKEPDFLPALGTLALAYKYLGMEEKAVATAERWVERSNGDLAAITSFAQALADAEKTTRAKEVLSEIEAADEYFDSSTVSYVYVSLGDLDSAFSWLERAYRERDWAITRLRTMPYWDPYIEEPNWIRFRTDPRYHELIERCGFPPLPPEHPGYEEDQEWRQEMMSPFSRRSSA